jgi:hypothetical protein
VQSNTVPWRPRLANSSIQQRLAIFSVWLLVNVR